MHWRAGDAGRSGRGRALRSRPDASHRAAAIGRRRLLLHCLTLAFGAIAASAAAQVSPAPFVTVMPEAQGVPATVRDAVQRLPATPALEAPLRSAACAFAEGTRHLDRLASNVAWAQPAAVVLFAGLPGLQPGHRAVVLRPTRELLARAATREVIARGDVSLHAIDLSPLPVDAPTPSFMALHVAAPATPPEGCVTQPR